MNNVLQGVLVLDTATSLKLKKEGKVDVTDNGLNVEVTLNKETGLCDFIQHNSTRDVVIVPNNVTVVKVPEEVYLEIVNDVRNGNNGERQLKSGLRLEKVEDYLCMCGKEIIESKKVSLVVRR